MKSTQKGFTLVELIIAISIVAVMVASGAIMYSRYLQDSRDSRRRLDILALRSALELYRANSLNGNYPTVLQDLVPIYIQAVPTDPKAVSYTYAPTNSAGGGCNYTAGNLCVTYTISIPLESGTMYTVRPNSAP